MNGVKYHRLAKGLSQGELAQRAGIKVTAVTQGENSHRRHTVAFFLAVRSVLGVTLEELARNDYPDNVFETRRVAQASRTDCPGNPIAEYRRARRLKLEELGRLLGVTKQRVSIMCASEKVPLKHISTLAAHENIGTEDFIKTYSAKGVVYES